MAMRHVIAVLPVNLELLLTYGHTWYCTLCCSPALTSVRHMKVGSDCNMKVGSDCTRVYVSSK